MKNVAETKAPETCETLTRADVEWAPGGQKPCDCGHDDCLICEVEALAVPVD